MKDTLLILQARTGSTRLPGKMVKDFYKGKTIVDIILQKLLLVFKPEQIVVATTIHKNDDKLVEAAHRNGVNIFRGDEQDVLGRFISCAENFEANKIVRICADNPFLLPEYITPLIDNLNNKNLEYCSYQWPDGTPIMQSHIGVFAEAMTINFLKKINELTDEAFYHEHVTNYLYTNKEEFQHEFLPIPNCLLKKKYIRLTVDSMEDFLSMQMLYTEVNSNDKNYNLEELIQHIEENSLLLEKMRIEVEKNAK